MRLTTKDLCAIGRCPKRWAEEPPEETPYCPIRELTRHLFLAKAIIERSSNPFKLIAKIWDKIFWVGREKSKKNIDLSVKGILSSRRLYKKIEKYKDMTSHPSQNLVCEIDSSIKLTSSGDFFLHHPDRMETWIYTSAKPEEVARTPLLAAEHFIAQSKVRPLHQQPFFLVLYHTKPNRLKPTHYSIRSTRPIDENRKIVTSLTNIARTKVPFTLGGVHCEECPVQDQCKPWVASSKKESKV